MRHDVFPIIARVGTQVASSVSVHLSIVSAFVDGGVGRWTASGWLEKMHINRWTTGGANMNPEINSNVGLGERLFKILPGCILLMGSAMVMGCILLVGGAMVIPADVVTTALICAAVLLAATTGCCLPYFHPEIFGGKDSLKESARKSPREGSHKFSVKPTENVLSKLDCPLSDDRPNNGLGSESLLDAAVERIIRSMDRDLRIL